MLKFKLIVLVVLMLTGFDVLADKTSAAGKVITSVRFDGAANHLYFETDGRWGAEGCDPIYVWVLPSLLGQKEILSIGLAAKMANKKVWFSGECHTDGNYFKATYITIL
jgi:hypothetical protein